MNGKIEKEFLSIIDNYEPSFNFFFFHIFLADEEYVDDNEIITPIPFLYDERAIKLLLLDNNYGIVLNYLYKYRDDLTEKIIISLLKKDFECMYYFLQKKYLKNNIDVDISPNLSEKEITFKTEDVILEFNLKYFDDRIKEKITSSPKILETIKKEIINISKKISKK